MPYKVVLPEKNKNFANVPAVKQEVSTIQQYLDEGYLKFPKNAIDLAIIHGSYKHAKRTMETLCLFVNGYKEEVVEISGTIILQIPSMEALVARTHFAFTQDFMGILKPNEAMLVHFDIPVKGLDEDKEIQTTEFVPETLDFRYTPLSTTNEQEKDG